GEGGRVAEAAVLGDIAQQPPHNLAGTCLRQIRSEHDIRGSGELADLVTNVLTEFGQFGRTAVHIPLESDIGDDGLTGVGIRPAAHCGFRDIGVVDDGGLDLDGRDPVSGNVHDIVDTAEHPEVTVLVDTCPVGDEVTAGVLRPVSVLVTLRVVVNAPQHRGPRLRDHQIPTSAGADLVTGLVVH